MVLLSVFYFGVAQFSNIIRTAIANESCSNSNNNNNLSFKLLVFGDSLTAGYGLNSKELAFPARLEKALSVIGCNIEVIDAGISGDTTASGKSRLSWSLSEDIDAVLIELGGNDGLRGIDPEITYNNLKSMLEVLDERRLPVLLSGMHAPPNLGRDYGDKFYEVYEKLAKEFEVIYYPFFLEGVAGDPSLNQPDRIHPNTLGVDIIVKKITPYVKRLVQ